MKLPWGFEVIDETSDGKTVTLRYRVSLARLAFDLMRLAPMWQRPFWLVAVAAVAVHRHARVLCALAVVGLATALLSGCSPAQSLARSVQPIALHEVQHPEYGACHEVGARAVSRTLQRELIVYAGACLGRIDGGVAGDAAVSE